MATFVKDNLTGREKVIYEKQLRMSSDIDFLLDAFCLKHKEALVNEVIEKFGIILKSVLLSGPSDDNIINADELKKLDEYFDFLVEGLIFQSDLVEFYKELYEQTDEGQKVREALRKTAIYPSAPLNFICVDPWAEKQ